MSERERCPTCGAEVPRPEDFGVPLPSDLVLCLRSISPASDNHRADCLARALDARDARLRAVEAEAAVLRQALVALGVFVNGIALETNRRPTPEVRALFERAMDGTAGRALLDEAERLRIEVSALGNAPDGYGRWQGALMESRQRLEAAGYGKPGHSNTLYGMVHDACAEVEQLRALTPAPHDTPKEAN